MKNQIKDTKKAIFIGVAQNCAKDLPMVLKNISNLSDLFHSSAFLFIENDSSDNTRQILESWGVGRPRFTYLNMNGLNSIPIKTLRLEFLRNACIEFVINNAVYSEYDYLIILDMDNSSAFQIDPVNFLNAIEFLDSKESHAGIFANQNGMYYDMWAFRHAEFCPRDVWEEVLDYTHKHKVTDEVSLNNTLMKRVKTFPVETGVIPVDSAFGGFGIYKMSFVVKNPNPYLGSKIKQVHMDDGSIRFFRLQTCEHVHFNAGIKAIGGELFIHKGLVNGNTQGAFNPPASYFRNLIF